MDRPLLFRKRRQLFFSAHDETLSVAMRVHNPDCLPLKIDSRYAVPTPTGLADIIGDYFAILLRFRNGTYHYAGGF